MARNKRKSSGMPTCTDALQATRLLTARDIADKWKLSLRTVRRFIAAGELIVHRFGRTVRVAEADLEHFLAARRFPSGTLPDVRKPLQAAENLARD